jgi:hypothetical protein
MGIVKMAIRQYKLINRSEREILTARLTDGIRRWSTRYVPDEARADCTIVLPGEVAVRSPDPHEWVLAARQSMPVLAVGLSEDWPRCLARLVLTERQAVGLDPAGLQLLRELGAGLLEELGQSVLEAIHPGDGGLVWDRASAPTVAGRPADGQVSGHCRLGDTLDVVLRIWPETVQRCLATAAARRAPAAAVEPLSAALREEKVVLDGIAGEAELVLEELTTLAVGDVIKLNRKITEPLQVCVRGGDVVCAARLGTSKGRTALQLT